MLTPSMSGRGEIELAAAICGMFVGVAVALELVVDWKLEDFDAEEEVDVEEDEVVVAAVFTETGTVAARIMP